MKKPKWLYRMFWTDLRYNYFSLPIYRFKLLKGQDCPPWDIVDSSVDILFQQVIQLWKNGGMKEELEYIRDDGTPWMEYLKTAEHCEHQYKSNLLFKKIYDYITITRPYNLQLWDDLLIEMWKYDKIHWDKKKDEKDRVCFQLRSEQLEGAFDIEVSFDENDKMFYKKIPVSEKSKYFEIEERLFELDNKYANLIIENRRGFWK